MHKILLAGYYGLNNIGDEAILEKFIQTIQEISKDVQITVMSGKPEFTEKVYGVTAIDRKDFFKVNREIKRNNIVIFGGGSLLQDVTSKRSIYYYFYIIMLSLILKKKVILLSQGIGPIRGRFNRIFTSFLLNRVQYITVRDTNSYEELIELKISKGKIEFSADPVIDYNNIIKEKEIGKKQKTIGISFRYWKDSEVITPLLEIIKKLKSEGIDVLMIPFHYNEDIRLIDEIEEKSEFHIASIKNKMTPAELYEEISKLDLLVGSRLHSLIFAVSAEIPITAVSYDPKVEYFMKSIGETSVCDITDMDSEIIVKDILKKLGTDVEYKAKKEVLKKTLEKNKEIIKKVIEV
jgi:polysaccharide pyruvyl transferase CsaB